MGCGAFKAMDWAPMGGNEFDVILTGESNSPVRLVDARYLIELHAKGQRLVHRQAMPEAAFLSLRQVQSLGPEEQEGSLRVIIVSYPWLQPDHPDPHGTTLALLARVLKAYIRFSGGTYGVFLECVCPGYMIEAAPHRMVLKLPCSAHHALLACPT